MRVTGRCNTNKHVVAWKMFKLCKIMVQCGERDLWCRSLNGDGLPHQKKRWLMKAVILSDKDITSNQILDQFPILYDSFIIINMINHAQHSVCV